MDDQLADLFGDRAWISREAAQAAAALSERMGIELERVTIQPLARLWGVMWG